LTHIVCNKQGVIS